MSAMSPSAGSILPQRMAALLEQGAVAGANFIAFLLFARVLEPAVWGQFGFAWALVLFAQGFQRALVTIPMISFTAGGHWTAARARWGGANTALALGASAALLLAAVALDAARLGGAWLATSLLMASAMLLPAMAHEFARRAAVQEARYDLLAATGALYAAVMLAAALVPVPAPWRPWMPALGLAGGAAAAALLYALAARQPVLPRPQRWPGDDGYRAFGGWAVACHLGYSGYNFGVQALLAALAGPAAVGVFHACRTLVQPVATLQAAMDSIDKPRAASALAAGGPGAMRRVLLRALLIVAALALPYLALVALAAEPLLQLAYGSTYAGHGPVVLLWCVAALCGVVSQPVESGLYVARRTRALFAGRALAAVASLALAVPLIQAYGAAGALAAIAAGFALAAAAGALTLRRLN